MLLCGHKLVNGFERGHSTLKKSERRQALVEYLKSNPFATDDQLAERFHVSIPTIRLDRSTLQIPEVRERIRQVAAGHHDHVRSLERQEVLGELQELQLNRFAVSKLEIAPAYVFSRTGIVRGHVLFGQVNSLAVAVMDADFVLTAKSELRFHRSVKLGDILLGRVDVIAMRRSVAKCKVLTTAEDGMPVVEGTIWVVASTEEYTSSEVEG